VNVLRTDDTILVLAQQILQISGGRDQPARRLAVHLVEEFDRVAEALRADACLVKVGRRRTRTQPVCALLELTKRAP